MTDRLEDIKAKWNIPAARPMNVPHGKDDVAWLINEVERLRSENESLRRAHDNIWAALQANVAKQTLDGREKP